KGVEAEGRIVGPDIRAADRHLRNQVPVDGVAEGFIDANALHVDGKPLRRALQRRSRETAIAEIQGQFVALNVVGSDAGDALHERLDHVRRIVAREVRGGERLHHRRHLAAVNAETGDGRRSDGLKRGQRSNDGRGHWWRGRGPGGRGAGGRRWGSCRGRSPRRLRCRFLRRRYCYFRQRHPYLPARHVPRHQGAGQCQRADRGGPQQGAFRGRKPRHHSTTFPRPTHGTNRRISRQILKHSPSAGLMMFWQFASGTFGNVAAGPQAASHHRELVSRPDHQRACHVCGEYYVISIESEDTNMSIRGKSILTTFAISLIATTPAWSQSLLKTLDPDNDGTVDLAEAKNAASKLFDKLDRDHDGTLDKRELRGRVNAKDFAAADPDNDGTLDKNEFLALVEKRFNAANPDNDGTIDAKELKSAAGRSLARLLK